MRLTFVTLAAEELETSVAFYADLFPDLKMVRQHEFAYLQFAGIRVALIERGKLAETASMEFAATGHCNALLSINVESREEVDTLWERVIALNGKVTKAPHTTTWGAYSFFFQDRDMHGWEITWQPAKHSSETTNSDILQA